MKSSSICPLSLLHCHVRGLNNKFKAVAPMGLLFRRIMVVNICKISRGASMPASGISGLQDKLHFILSTGHILKWFVFLSERMTMIWEILMILQRARVSLLNKNLPSLTCAVCQGVSCDAATGFHILSFRCWDVNCSLDWNTAASEVF